MALSDKLNTQDAERVVVLINLGTPQAPTPAAVRRYLFEFLMDPCVIDLSYFRRLMLVGGIIVPLRAFGSSRNYRKIWQPNGSPLLTISRALNAAVQKSTAVPVLLAMRYGTPSIAAVLPKALSLLSAGGTLHVIPLYPHHAMSTTLTVYLAVERTLKQLCQNSEFSRQCFHTCYETPFYQHPHYLHALTASIAPYTQTLGKPDGYEHILFSYHGIPLRHLSKVDDSAHCKATDDCCESAPCSAHQLCYRHQALSTTAKVQAALCLPAARVSSSFQSRLGKAWLRPYTDETVKELARRGIKRLLVVAPAFVSDNLETLYEIAIENAELFRQAGGTSLKLIPCLNTAPRWVETLAAIIAKPRDFSAPLRRAANMLANTESRSTAALPHS